MHSGLITTNPKLVNIDSLDLYEEYINEETQKLIDGVPFFSLFKMLIEDIEYNLSVFSSLANLPFSERIVKYIDGRHCPFISILIFVTATGVIGSIGYIAIRFIFDMIFKKSSNYLIPSLVLLGSFVVMLNVSTFTTIKFFDGNHNIANLYRILFFETSKLTLTFVISVLLSLVMVAIQFIDLLLEFLENKKNKNNKLMTKVIVYGSIIGSFTILLLTGLIFK